VSDPFTAYSFRVEILLPGAPGPLCDAAFAECDGLELRFDVTTLREGGDNAAQVLLAGPASYGQITLRRGMTSSLDLWEWGASVLRDPSLRADGRIVVLAPDGESERAAFRLHRCLPVRLKGPALHAADGVVAVEELELACEAIVLEGTKLPPRPDARAELVGADGRVARVQLNPERLRLVTAAGETRLALELWFDATVAGGDADVRELLQPILALVRDTSPVRLRWGAFAFAGTVESLEESLELFAPDGRPLRARLGLTLKYLEERSPRE
jgi:phage tail-like protein